MSKKVDLDKIQVFAENCTRSNDLKIVTSLATMRHEQLSVRMAVAAAVHHSRDRTRTAVDTAVQAGGCVEQNVDAPVSESVEQIIEVPV